ncbi:MAG: hypothetical protein GXN91_04370, partial [Epsilonproteobacteria bacterium]|nr:hypothetical protein [Campylobacterota bacterium]
KYTYNYYPLDLQLSFQAGKYWKQDVGFDIEAKKFFGDIAVSLKFLYSKPDDNDNIYWSEDSNKYIGLYIEIPLDFSKSKTNWKRVQLEGDKAFKYGLRSTIDRDDGTNRVTPGLGEEPMFDIEHYKHLTNRNRTGYDYLKYHIEKF